MNEPDPTEGAKERLQTVRGILVPVDWDEEGHVTAFAVSARNEMEYFVDKNDRWKELLSLIRKEVEVIGVVNEGDAQKTITVTEFRLPPAPEM